jgi:hypothetical protein
MRLWYSFRVGSISFMRVFIARIVCRFIQSNIVYYYLN